MRRLSYLMETRCGRRTVSRMPEGRQLDLHDVQAMVSWRFPDVPEHNRTYMRGRAGHWLVRFDHPRPDVRPDVQDRQKAAAGLGWVGGCLVHGRTGEVALLPDPSTALVVGFGPDSIDWDAAFPGG